MVISMRKIYFPQQLKSEVLKLEKQFGSLQNSGIVSQARLEEIIKQIVNCEETELQLYAFTLSKLELKAVAMYIKNNFLKVDLSKVFEIFVIIDSFYCFQIIYETWQLNYKEPYDYHFVKRVIEHYEDDIVLRYQIPDVRILASWMSSEKSEEHISQYLADKCNGLDDLHMELKKLGLDERYALYKDIQSVYLCYCNENTYVRIGDQRLLECMRAVNLESQRNIMYNFLRVVNYDKFDQFENIANYAYSSLFGSETDSLYRKTIGQTSEGIRLSYKALINVFWLLKLFGRDARSQFWRKYIKKFKVDYYSEHNMLLMAFRRSIVVEFKEIGPIYFFDADYFYENIKKKMSYKNTVDLKWDLRNISDYKYMKEHRGYWQYAVNAALRRYAL